MSEMNPTEVVDRMRAQINKNRALTEPVLTREFLQHFNVPNLEEEVPTAHGNISLGTCS